MLVLACLAINFGPLLLTSIISSTLAIASYGSVFSQASIQDLALEDYNEYYLMTGAFLMHDLWE